MGVHARLDVVAATTPRQHFHVVTVFHRDDATGEQAGWVGQGEVALRLAEGENRSLHGDLAFSERRSDLFLRGRMSVIGVVALLIVHTRFGDFFRTRGTLNTIKEN